MPAPHVSDPGQEPGMLSYEEWRGISRRRVAITWTEGETPVPSMHYVEDLKFSPAEWSDIVAPLEGPRPIIMHDPYYFWGESTLRMEDETGKWKMSARRGPVTTPLAPITSNKMNLGALRTLGIPFPSRLQELLTWIETDRIARELAASPPQQFRKGRIVRHMLSDARGLVEKGIFSWKDGHPRAPFVPIFKVKKGEDASRLIGDAREINDLLPAPGDMGLPLIHRLIRDILGGFFIAQCDGRSYFYQISLCEEAAACFPFMLGQERGRYRKGRWEVLPMGFKFAPAIAQHISLHVCEAAMVGKSGSITPWVDNFLFRADSEEEMQGLFDAFDQVTEHVNLEIKPGREMAKAMDALGLHFDVTHANKERHWVSVSEENKVKIRASQDLIAPSMTPREFLKVFGTAMWGLHVVARKPLAVWAETLQCLSTWARDLAKGLLTWDTKMDISPTVQHQLQDMGRTVQAAKLTLGELAESPSSDTIWWTDASGKDGLGYVMEQGAKRWAQTDQWDTSEAQIYIWELLAAAQACVTMGGTGTVCIDNKAAAGAVSKGHSAHYGANHILRSMYAKVHAGDLHVRWVPTACQWADAPSHGRFLTEKPCSHVHEATRVRWRA